VIGPRPLALAALAASLAIAAGVSLGAEPSAQARAADPNAVAIQIDLAARRQVIQGFGTSNRVWDDPHLANLPRVTVPVAAQERILSLLYRRLGLTRVRPIVELQNSSVASFNFDWKLGAAHIAFVKQARPHGLKTYFPSPANLGQWMRADDPGAYVDWAVAMLKYWRANGLELPLFSPLNEPTINGNYPTRWLRDVVVELGRRMRAAGLETKLVIPDDENPADAYRRAAAILQDPKARQYVGALAYHTYSNDLSDIARLRQLGTKYNLPVWMTEWNNQSGGDWGKAMGWARRVHLFLTVGGVNAVDYMWGYFGNFDQGQLVSIDFTGGTFRGFSETPAYWITGHYSRYIRPGNVRVAAVSGSGRVLTSAYTDRRRLIIVATNPGDAPQNVRINIRSGELKGAVRPVRSSASERWRSLPPLSIRGRSFTASLPPESVTTFVAERS
jgi:glucuronoarabinoxylan endo-1,4-beta-xylanase